MSYNAEDKTYSLPPLFTPFFSCLEHGSLFVEHIGCRFDSTAFLATSVPESIAVTQQPRCRRGPVRALVDTSDFFNPRVAVVIEHRKRTRNGRFLRTIMRWATGTETTTSHNALKVFSHNQSSHLLQAHHYSTSIIKHGELPFDTSHFHWLDIRLKHHAMLMISDDYRVNLMINRPAGNRLE